MRGPIRSPVTYLTDLPWPQPFPEPTFPASPPPSITAEDRKAILRRHFVTMLERKIIAERLSDLEIEQLIEVGLKLRDEGLL